jgi:hypothetical protein
MNQRINQNLSHGIGRNKRRFDPSHMPRHNLGRKGEVPLAKQFRFLQQFKRRSSNLALIKKLCLVRATETGHAQFALRVVRQEGFAEENDSSLKELIILAQSQPIEHVRQALPHRSH